jgi:predicted histidine transporter YuiF (NhaC family)
MNERELGRALLNLDGAALAGTSDVRQQTWKILDRDRRRVRRLTLVTIAIWLLAVALIVGVLVAFGFIFPREAQLFEDMQQREAPAAERAKLWMTELMAFQKGTLLMAFSIAMLAFAAISTVLLVFASRRATLRQINSSLVEVSEQLKQMRQKSPTGPA